MAWVDTGRRLLLHSFVTILVGLRELFSVVLKLYMQGALNTTRGHLISIEVGVE